MTGTALILGASGKIGTHFTRAFQAAGWTTRPYRRGTDMTVAAMGADVIVNGLNPPNYHDWAGILPAITAQVLAAARASGATVIIPGNVYVFGDTPGEWSETTPHRPCSRKGQLRVEMEAAFRAAASDGVRTIILRAGDFIDPDANGSIMDIVYLRGLKAGKITSPGAPDKVRANTWLPDLARAGVALADKRADLPAFADVPFPGHAFSVRHLADEIARQTGRPMRIVGFPWWLFTLTAPFWELAREMREMRYLWNTAHTLSGARLAEYLPDFRPTPLAEVVRQSVNRQIHPDQPVTGGALA